MEKFDNKQQAEKAMQMAFGRILRLGSRPFEEGDIENYETAKSVFLDAADYIALDAPKISSPCYASDYKNIHKD